MGIQRAYYAIIPANVRYDKTLTPNAKLLYGEITALCNEKGFCWASNEYFSELYGVSKTSISKWISSLIERGYLQSEIIYKEGSKEILNRYLRIVKDPIEEKLNTYLTKVKDPIEEKLNTPIEEKLKDNNTYINNTMNNTYEYTYMSDGVEKAEPVKDYEEKFNIFYKAYPKKVAKTKVLSWFRSNKPKDDLFELMMKKLEVFKKSYNWNKDNGQYIPNPTTWLNQKRWEDEIEIATNLGGTHIKTEGQQLLEMIKGGVFDE